MKKQKHTPGPWLYRSDFLPSGCIENFQGRRICDLELPSKGRTISTDKWSKQCRANGLLIASAPMMLNTLQKISTWMKWLPATKENTIVFQMVASAIRRAGG